eukprot:gene10568-12294_t
MKKINKAYGEAKVSVLEKMGKKDSMMELPDYKLKTKTIDDLRSNFKEVSSRLQKQSKAHQALINDNTSLADSFSDYGNQLLQEEESSAAILGPTLTILGDMHNQFEVTRSKLDIGIGNTLMAPLAEYLKTDLKDAMFVKARYDKFRVSFDASSESYKNLRKKQNIAPEKLAESEQDLHIATQQFSDVAVESLYIFEDIIDKITIESVDNYIMAYQEYFQKGMDIVKEILPNIERQKQSTAKLRKESEEKKKRRGEHVVARGSDEARHSGGGGGGGVGSGAPVLASQASASQGKRLLFGIPLETMQSRDGVVVPAIVCKAIQHLDQKKNLDVEGLFRVGPNQKHLNDMKAAINAGSMTSFDAIDDTHLVTSFIKSFLRELPTPLLTYELFSPLTQCVVETLDENATAPIDNPKVSARLATILKSLPPCNITLFRMLMKLLSKIASNSKINKMTTSNLAVVLAPNILYPLTLDMESITCANATIEFIIRNYSLVFQDQENGGNDQQGGPPPLAKVSNHRQSVILNQTAFIAATQSGEQTMMNGSHRRSVTPPHLPTKPSPAPLQRTGSGQSTPPPLPVKRLSSSTSQLQPPPTSPTTSSTSLNSSPEPARKNISNRLSVLLSAPPTLPPKPQSGPPPLAALNYASSQQQYQQQQANMNNSLHQPNSRSSFRGKLRPQGMKLSGSSTTTMSSPDGTKATYNLLDDTLCITSEKPSSKFSDDDDLIEW